MQSSAPLYILPCYYLEVSFTFNTSMHLHIQLKFSLNLFRKDFWLDGFYMFFNFFIFSLLLFNAVSNMAAQVFSDFLSLFGVTVKQMGFAAQLRFHWMENVVYRTLEYIPLGPLKYILNNPWDYLFKTDYIPKNGRDIIIGFPGNKKFPKRFFYQVMYPFKK